MARDPQPTWVYRLYCEHEMILYVGVASDVERRLKQHRETKPWWPEVSIIEARRFGSRQEALELEAATISAKSPKYNIAGQRAPIVGVSAYTPLPYPVLTCRTYRVAAGRVTCVDEWEG